jgi:FixJ family two-component response regulator
MSPHKANQPRSIVHIVDDDAAVCRSISLLVRTAGLQAQTYRSAAAFLRDYRPDGSACLLLDVRLPDMDGLELQAMLAEKGVIIPVIMISGQADIPMAVSAIKQGAMDFVEKPFTRGRLLELVRRALAMDAREHTWRRLCTEVSKRLPTLTPRERCVLHGLLQGKMNKQVAAELGISRRTVEAHRAHILRKLGLRSLSVLLRIPLNLQEQDGRSK